MHSVPLNHSDACFDNISSRIFCGCRCSSAFINLKLYLGFGAVCDPSLWWAGARRRQAWCHLHRDLCFLSTLSFAPYHASSTSASIVPIAAMEADASSASQGPANSPLNFIFACSVCCATFADAYEGHSETVQGLSDGINPKDRLVTKLYLGSCCHVFCGEHIEGGGEQHTGCCTFATY